MTTTPCVIINHNIPITHGTNKPCHYYIDLSKNKSICLGSGYTLNLFLILKQVLQVVERPQIHYGWCQFQRAQKQVVNGWIIIVPNQTLKIAFAQQLQI